MFDIHEKALNHCRAMFVKDLDLPQVIEYMALDGSCLYHHRGGSQATREEQIVHLLDYLIAKNEKSFAAFMNFLNENQKHLFTLMEETIKSFRSRSEVQGSHDEAVMTGETLKRLLMKRKKSVMHKTQSDPMVSSGDSENSHKECEEHKIHCSSMIANIQQHKEKWINCMNRQDDIQKDKTLSMSVVISDSVFRKISLSDMKIPDLVRCPPKQCEVYVYVGAQGRTAEKKAVHGIKNGIGSNTFIDDQGNGKRKFGSCGMVPPPVPPKPNHLPLIGFNVRVPSTQTKNGDEVKFSTENRKKREALKNSPADLLALIMSQSIPVGRKMENLSSLDGLTFKENVAKTATATGDCDETGERDGNSLATSQREKQEYDLAMNEECLLDYNVSIDSASDLGFEEKTMTGEEREKTWMVETLSEPSIAVVESEPMPAYSSVDLQKKSSRIKGTTDEDRQALKIEVFVNDVEEFMGNKEDEVVRITEKLLVDSLPDETFPVSEATEPCNVALGTEHHQKMSCDAADPLLPANQSSLCELPDDEDDTSSSNSDYEDIDVLNQIVSGFSKVAANGETYLDPKTKERTSGIGRGFIQYEDRSKALPYKIIPKGYLLLVESVDTCEELPLSKSSEYFCFHNTLHESCVQIFCSDTSASLSDKKEVTEIAEKATSESNLRFNQRPDILCETVTDCKDISQYFRGTKLAFDKDGHALYVPCNLVKKFGDPDGEPWFYPLSMTARQATLFLMMEKLEGCFVVYQPVSESPGVMYNLSVCLGSGDVVHYRLVENVLGDISIEGHDHSFTTLSELVDYFSKNKSSLATRLRRPLKYARLPITPGFHYDIGYELERKELSLTGNIIGQGCFGVVCSGVYRGHPVAVKVLQQTDGMLSDEDDFLEEAKSLMGLRHEHVVRLVGVSCMARPFFIVTEFASRGSVKDCLRNGKLRSDSVSVIFNICLQMVSAMSYLEAKHFMLHRDLASRNFLMANDSCVKLADFGRARLVADDNYQAPRKERICIKWSSPEVLIYSRYSSKSDVWAMGVVFWELFSGGDRPYAFLSGEDAAVYVMEGGRLDKPSECPADLYQLMRSCWKEHPRQRPTFAQLHEQLKTKSSVYHEQDSLRSKKGPNLAVGGTHLPVTPTSSKPATPSMSAKFRLTYPIAKKSDKFTLQRETSDDRRNSFEPKLLVYRSRAGTSSSETSIASGNGFLELERGEEDLTRGDRIRKSLRNLMKIKTKGKAGARVDTPRPKGYQGTL